MWDLIVSVPDHCLSFYFSQSMKVFDLPCCLLLLLEISSKSFNIHIRKSNLGRNVQGLFSIRSEKEILWKHLNTSRTIAT